MERRRERMEGEGEEGEMREMEEGKWDGRTWDVQREGG